jgi:hypothetical protein
MRTTNVFALLIGGSAAAIMAYSPDAKAWFQRLPYYNCQSSSFPEIPWMPSAISPQNTPFWDTYIACPFIDSSFAPDSSVTQISVDIAPPGSQGGTGSAGAEACVFSNWTIQCGAYSHPGVSGPIQLYTSAQLQAWTSDGGGGYPEIILFPDTQNMNFIGTVIFGN